MLHTPIRGVREFPVIDSGAHATAHALDSEISAWGLIKFMNAESILERNQV
jgi:hypothetical protein